MEQRQLYLSSYFALKGNGKDDGIFDIYNTLLSTVPYFKKYRFGGDKLNLTSLEEWVQKSKVPDLDHIALIFIGTLAMATQPFMAVVFGQLFNSFGQTGPSNIVHAISKISLQFVYIAIGAGTASCL